MKSEVRNEARGRGSGKGRSLERSESEEMDVREREREGSCVRSVSKRGGVSNGNGVFGEVDEVRLWKE